jgi:hypothetical protein
MRLLRAPSPGQTEEPRSQNVKWMLSERETVVELPCPCVVEAANRVTSNLLLVSETVWCSWCPP